MLTSNILQTIRRNADTILKLLPLLSFVVPFVILYFFQYVAFPPYPYYYRPYSDSFEITWKGRLFYIFFLWIASLEMILYWDKLQPNKTIKTIKSKRTAVFIVAILLPTIYTIISNFGGLNRRIVDWTYAMGIVPGCDYMPLAVEYLVFGVLFALILWSEYGTSGLKDALISPIFLVTIGVIYSIDNIYSEGQFTPFQAFVPTTAMLAEKILNLMGYQTSLWLDRGMPFLYVISQNGSGWGASIAWPCSGVESLIIYTLVILLFLRTIVPSWKQRIIYFTIGAIITYFINALRIVTIFVIAVNGGDWVKFHDFYGQLYSITWIVSYPLIIIGSRTLWTKIRSRKTNGAENQNILNQNKPSQTAPSIP
jgi:thaumarchaeosortase